VSDLRPSARKCNNGSISKLSKLSKKSKLTTCSPAYFLLFLLFTFLTLFCVFFMFYGLMPEIKMDWIGLDKRFRVNE